MNIPTSSIAAARAYLLAQIEATVTSDPTDTTAELLVSLDEPGTHQPEDVVIVGDVHQTYQPYAGVGSGEAYWLEENYSVEITISVFRSGDDGTNALAHSVFARARTLADQVVNIVRSDPSLGGAVQRARPGTVTHQSTWATGEVTGRVTEIQIPVECINVL